MLLIMPYFKTVRVAEQPDTGMPYRDTGKMPKLYFYGNITGMGIHMPVFYDLGQPENVSRKEEYPGRPVFVRQKSFYKNERNENNEKRI
jgi:hypothetical protein